MNSKPIFERTEPSLANKNVALQTVTTRFNPLQPEGTAERASSLECPESVRGFRASETLPNSMPSIALKSAVAAALCQRSPKPGGFSPASDWLFFGHWSLAVLLVFLRRVAVLMRPFKSSPKRTAMAFILRFTGGIVIHHYTMSNAFLHYFFDNATHRVVAENPVLPVRLPQDIISRLDALAERIGSNRSQVIRVCIQSFVEEFERTGKAMLPPNWRELLSEFDKRTVASRTRYPSPTRSLALNERPSPATTRAKSLASRTASKAAREFKSLEKKP